MSLSPDALTAAHLIERLERLARAGAEAERLNPAQWNALRFIASANRFSRTPAALAEFLASTRGTISRTLMALEKNGYVSRDPSPTDGRGVLLSLTPRGENAVRNDPLLALARDIERATAPHTRQLVDSLAAVLRNAVARNGGRPFGLCHACRHFRGHAQPSSSTPHHCDLLDEPLSEADSRKICIEHEAA